MVLLDSPPQLLWPLFLQTLTTSSYLHVSLASFMPSYAPCLPELP